MDADDEFWVSLDIPVLKNIFTILNGLSGLVDSVKDLDFIRFTTPYRYLTEHPPEGEVSLRQDTADGSFDGISSWAEKWSNHMLWTGIERSRICELQTLQLMIKKNGDYSHVRELLDSAFKNRLRALTTTHFGMAAPVMNLPRLKQAGSMIADSVEKALEALDKALTISGEEVLEDDSFTIIDYTRGESTSPVIYESLPSRGLLRLPLNKTPDERSISLNSNEGNSVIASVHVREEEPKEAEILMIDNFKGGEKKKYTVNFTDKAINTTTDAGRVILDEHSITNGQITVEFDSSGNCVSLKNGDSKFRDGPFISSAITYGGKRYEVTDWNILQSGVLPGGQFGILRTGGSVTFRRKGLHTLNVEREFIVAADLPYLYLTVSVSYPTTPHQKYDRDKAKRLMQTWDGNWQEVIPCQLAPGLSGEKLRVWKHNYFGDVSSFEPDYSSFSKNRELDSFNNHVTWGWVSVTDGSRGILLAQSADYTSSMAFCPMRTRRKKDANRIYLNPFGSYDGKQLLYPTAHTGLGRFAAIQASASDHLTPYAPSYNGRSERFSLLIAPYSGDEPPEEIQQDAIAFTYPGLVISNGKLIRKPAHREWKNPFKVDGQA